MLPSFNTNPHNAFAAFFEHEGIAPFAYALSKKMQDGHSCLDLTNMPQEAEFWAEYTGCWDNLSKDSLIGHPLVGDGYSQKLSPFVMFYDKLYLGRYFYYETKIIEGLKNCSYIADKEVSRRKEMLINELEFIKSLQSRDPNLSQFSEEEKVDWQLVAVLQGFLNNVTIITGGPGTGKTTTVAKILALLKRMQPDVKVALAAPTGKAAVRMKQSLLKSSDEQPQLGLADLVNSLNPKTLHRLLGYQYQSPFFKHNETHPLDVDVVIIDESSMIGEAMFAKLISAIGTNTRLLLLGDSEQLASVDLGSLFGDLCKTLTVNENLFSNDNLLFLNQFLGENRTLSERHQIVKPHCFLDQHLIRLKKTYRYENDSKMGKFTQAVIKGNHHELEEIVKIEDSSLQVDTAYSASVFNSFVEKYLDYIQEPDIKGALDKLNDCRVLCAVRESDEGIYSVNQKIENYLKKRAKSKGLNFKPNNDFYENQPIMVTQNLEELHLYNGDVGIIRKSEEHQKLMAYFPLNNKDDFSAIAHSEVKAINPGLISNWETVFAMTIHKSQGSEFKDVLVILPKKEQSKILTRELLYTAITRAKKGGVAILQSTTEVIIRTTERKVERVSGIAERINL